MLCLKNIVSAPSLQQMQNDRNKNRKRILEIIMRAIHSVLAPKNYALQASTHGTLNRLLLSLSKATLLPTISSLYETIMQCQTSTEMNGALKSKRTQLLV